MESATGIIRHCCSHGALSPSFLRDFASTERGGYRNLSTVAADRFDGATFHGFLAERFFLGIFGLLIDEGMAPVVVPFVIGRRRFAAKVAVDTLVVDVVRARDVFRIFICRISHNFPAK